MPSELNIKSPETHPNSLTYDNECREALTAELETLLEKAEAAGWQRGKAAAALMYLSAKRVTSTG